MVPLGITIRLTRLIEGIPVANDNPAVRLVEAFRVDLSIQEIRDAELRACRSIAYQAHLYALPAFLHMRQLTEFIQGRTYLSPEEPPIGGWVLVRKLSDPETDNRFPNVDTLYGAAYLMLAEHGPVVLSVPPIRDRYFSVALHDAYFNNFAIVGTSSGDVNGAKVLIAPPDWNGDVPSDVDRVIVSPTPILNLYQRIFVRSESEYETVQSLQDQIILTPLGGDPFPALDLSGWSIPGMRGISDPMEMFGHAKRYIALNGYPREDEGLVALIDTVGLGPSSSLPSDPVQLDAVRAGSNDAQDAIDARLSAGPFRNGWNIPDPEAGRSGPHLLSRAAIQASQIGSLIPTEAIYFFAHLDSQSSPLNGHHRYTLSFAAGELPSLGELGFWSVTMYGTDGLLVENELDRYVLRPDTPGLTYCDDGSLTLCLQADKPADRQANWLPSPSGEFMIALRAYRPRASVTDGSWFPPAVKRLDR